MTEYVGRRVDVTAAFCGIRTRNADRFAAQGDQPHIAARDPKPITSTTRELLARPVWEAHAFARNLSTARDNRRLSEEAQPEPAVCSPWPGHTEVECAIRG